MKRAHLITASALLLLTGVGGWSAWWAFLSTYGERVATAAMRSERAPHVAFARIERFGFPFTLGYRFTDASVRTPWGAGEATAKAARLVVTARPWRPNDLKIELPAGLRYAVADAGSGQGVAQAGALSGDVRYGEGAATGRPRPAIALNLTDIRLKPATSAPVEARRGRIVWSFDAADRQNVDVAFVDITLADTALFGPSAKKAEAALRLHGPLPRRGAPAEFRAWRDAGGKLEVAAAEIVWGALDVTAAGAFGLDAGFRLAGGLDLRIANGDAAVQRIESLGLLTRDGAAAARTLLSFAALGGGGRAQTPLAFADGVATLAGFPVAKLAPVCACP